MTAAGRKQNILKSIVIVLLLCLTGCQFFSRKEPMYVISLHELAAGDISSPQLTRIVQDPQQTRQVEIRTYAFLDARRLYEAEIIPGMAGSGKYGLRLHVDPRGRNSLLQTAAQRRGESFAVIVDGFFAGMSKFPNRLDDLSFFDLDPLWTAPEAEKIISATRDNYRQFNSKF